MFKSIVSVILFSIVLISCSKNPISSNEQYSQSIIGTWQSVNIGAASPWGGDYVIFKSDSAYSTITDTGYTKMAWDTSSSTPLEVSGDSITWWYPITYDGDETYRFCIIADSLYYLTPIFDTLHLSTGFQINVYGYDTTKALIRVKSIQGINLSGCFDGKKK